ncbi:MULTISPECIES: hypothetical protein [Micrococcaceae]|uniref:hypothetical protein n=1 Tax=Micrococcaceae TaxID=1268 RepID=UPI00105CB8B4|nr:hypothetical protein [Arthrobacter sp. JUb115]TDU21756.1 hypothetical protein EDF61_11171 [Arthrobacter sp. JUb115]
MTLSMMAIIFSGVSVFISASTYMTNQWARERSKVNEAVDALTTESIARCRLVIGAISRTDSQTTLNSEDHNEFVEAAFRLMWAIQRTAFATNTIKNSAIAPVEAQRLYHHLSVITPELSEAIKNHGHEVNWGGELQETNKVIRELPEHVLDGWSRKISKKNFKVLEKPSLITL